MSRKPWSVKIILFIVILILSACRSNDSALELAVMYRGGPQRTGLYDGQAVDQLNGVKWKFETGDGIWSSPVVADGVVYFGSDDDHLYAVDTETGQEKWRFKTENDVRSSPAIADGIVYVLSYDGNLYAVNSQDGQLVWEFRVFSSDGAEYRPDYDDYLSSPAVVEGVVYVGGVDWQHWLFALDAKTGQEVWRFGLADEFETTHSSPAVAGGMVYIGGDMQTFYALDTNTGELKWTFEGGTFNYAPAIGKDGTVYVGSKDTHLYALDGQTGSLKWKNNLAGSSWVTSSPALSKDLVYANTSDGRALFAVHRDTGETKWSFPIGGYGWSSPSLAGDMVYVGSGSGKLFALKAQTGQEVWSFETMESVYSTPAIANGVVYVGSLDGTMYALH